MPKSQMARIHPSTPLHAPLTAGDYRERDVLRTLGDGLPANFDVFHNLPWSSMHQGNQHFGELDLVVISPLGHILLIEVKAGAIEETTQSLIKTYGGINKELSNIGQGLLLLPQIPSQLHRKFPQVRQNFITTNNDHAFTY